MKKIISLILVVCYLVLFTPKVLGETTDYTPEEKPEVSSNYIYMYECNMQLHAITCNSHAITGNSQAFSSQSTG